MIDLKFAYTSIKGTYNGFTSNPKLWVNTETVNILCEHLLSKYEYDDEARSFIKKHIDCSQPIITKNVKRLLDLYENEPPPNLNRKITKAIKKICL